MTQVAEVAAQRARVAKLCGAPFRKGMVFPYVARRKGKLVGTAWFDVHRVRSKRQLLMVVVAPDLRVQRVEILAFAEPRKYMPPKRFGERSRTTPAPRSQTPPSWFVECSCDLGRMAEDRSRRGFSASAGGENNRCGPIPRVGLPSSFRSDSYARS